MSSSPPSPDPLDLGSEAPQAYRVASVGVKAGFLARLKRGFLLAVPRLLHGVRAIFYAQ